MPSLTSHLLASLAARFGEREALPSAGETSPICEEENHDDARLPAAALTAAMIGFFNGECRGAPADGTWMQVGSGQGFQRAIVVELITLAERSPLPSRS